MIQWFGLGMIIHISSPRSKLNRKCKNGEDLIVYAMEEYAKLKVKEYTKLKVKENGRR